MPLAPPPEPAEPTPAEKGVADAATAYATAVMMLAHWRLFYLSWFGNAGWTVAELQQYTDGIDADSIEHSGQRNAYEMVVAHHLLQQALRTALPAEIMAADPMTSPIPYTLEADEYGNRIVWDANATYPTEQAE